MDKKLQSETENKKIHEITKETQSSMMNFFMRTSIPRMINKRKKHIDSLAEGENK